MATITHGPLSYLFTSNNAYAHYRMENGMVVTVRKNKFGFYLCIRITKVPTLTTGYVVSPSQRHKLPLLRDEDGIYDVYTEEKRFFSIKEMNDFVRAWDKTHRNYKWAIESPWNWKDGIAPYNT